MDSAQQDDGQPQHEEKPEEHGAGDAGGAAKPPGHAGDKGKADDDKAKPGDEVQQPFFMRQLVEVFLLLDNVSATKEKKLPDKLADPVFGPQDDVNAKDWIQQIAEIRYPPDSASKQEQALQAAKLYRARDALNHAAFPATSNTIGFTLLVSGGQSSFPGFIRNSVHSLTRKALSLFLTREELKRWNERSDWFQHSLLNDELSRSEWAAIAFPNFVSSARYFRWYTWGLLITLLAWLAFTSILSWQVATGNALVHEISDLKTSIEELGGQAADADPSGKPPTEDTSGAKNNPDDGLAKDKVKAAPGDTGTPKSDSPYRPADQLAQKTAELQVARENLHSWLTQEVWFGTRLCDLFKEDCPRQKQPAGSPLPDEWQWASILVAILANNVLPILYGVLGAGAAVTRGLSQDMRDYLLTPRHLKMSVIQLALGAVIGATIGLFVSPAGDGSQTGDGLLENVRLSTAALCFIAGFGVEGVFQALETLITRLFNLEGPQQQAPVK